MSDPATELLYSEQDAELGERRSPATQIVELSEESVRATDKKRPLRQSAAFVVTASVILWTLIVLGVRQFF